MSDRSPINDFDAYRHEWENNSYTQSNNVSKFSLNNNSLKFSQSLNDLRERKTSFTTCMVGVCVFLYLISFFVPSVYFLAYNPIWALNHPWTILTSGFVHSGILHIVFNMLTLYYIGGELEKILGSTKTALIYILSIIGGTSLTVIYSLLTLTGMNTFTLGASGGIFGIFGAIFVIQKRQGISTTPMIILIIINLSMGFLVPNIAIMGHLGGLIFGTLTTYILTRQKVYYSKTLTIITSVLLFVIELLLCFGFYYI